MLILEHSSGEVETLTLENLHSIVEVCKNVPYMILSMSEGSDSVCKVFLENGTEYGICLKSGGKASRAAV